MDYNPLDSSVYGIFQAKMLERVVISYSRVIPDPGIEPVSLASPSLAGRFFTNYIIWAARVRFNRTAKWVSHTYTYSPPPLWTSSCSGHHSALSRVPFVQNVIPFLILPLCPSGLRSVKEKRGLKLSRTLWSIPGYKGLFVSPVSCL